MARNRKEGRNFGRIRRLFDRDRISYPTKLINDVISYSEIKANGIMAFKEVRLSHQRRSLQKHSRIRHAARALLVPD